jgi:hypothetical protein
MPNGKDKWLGRLGGRHLSKSRDAGPVNFIAIVRREYPLYTAVNNNLACPLFQGSAHLAARRRCVPARASPFVR